jgi:ATP-dependent DNA helicase PIF1
MGLLDALKDILGIVPVNIGELNRQATHARPSPPPVAPRVDPLEGIEITDEYRVVSKLVEGGFPIVFVSGKAGTGKSTLIHYLRHTFKKNVVVVAPTGVAALNVKGTTIHSYFQFPPRIVTDEDIKEVKDRRLYTKLDLLVVDEVSMVRADLVDAMDKFLRLNGRHQNRPFGGTQILLVGDLFQLPPVVTRSEESVLFARKYTSPFFFSAKTLENCQLAPVELSKIFRQRDPVFTDMLNKVRVAEQLNTVIPMINATCSAPDKDDQHIITLTCTNAAADQVNARELAKLPGEPTVFKGQVSGKFAVKDEKLPSPLNLSLKLGAQVMFTKNDGQKRWVNGTIGRVTAFKEASIQVELITDHPGALHEVQRAKWESFKYEYDYTDDKIKTVTTGTYIQYPLMLAWAVTIHKSQGKTLERVRVDLGDGAFASGQVYVALSRCRTLTDIALARPIDKHEVKCDERIKRFYLALAGMQPTPQAVEQEEPTRSHSVPSNRCPTCGGVLRSRNGKCGPFLGCSNYPQCKYTRNP